MELKIDHKVIRELMEEDPDFKIKVKSAILETAVKHESWRIIDTDTKALIEAQIRQLQGEFTERVRGVRTLNPALALVVKEHFTNSLQGEIADACEETRKAIIQKVEERAKYIESIALNHTEKVVNKAVAAFINKEVEERIAKVVAGLSEPPDVVNNG